MIDDAESGVDAALDYARDGFAVLPLQATCDGRCSCGREACTSPGKHPRTSHGVHDATTDADTIRSWWDQWPDANVGIATGKASGVIVIDIDIDAGHGKDGPLSIEHLEAEHGKLPDTVRGETGGGGYHLFFECPPEVVRSRVGLRPGVDVRGENGYVVAPPSTHVSGGRYEWEASSSISDVTPAPMPDWLLDELRATSTNGSHRADAPAWTAHGSPIPIGRRNVALTSMAGAMRAVGFDETTMRDALLSHNATCCEERLDPGEVAKIAASVARYEPNAPKAGGVFLPRDLLCDRRLRARPIATRFFLYIVSNAAWPRGCVEQCKPSWWPRGTAWFRFMG